MKKLVLFSLLALSTHAFAADNCHLKVVVNSNVDVLHSYTANVAQCSNKAKDRWVGLLNVACEKFGSGAWNISVNYKYDGFIPKGEKVPAFAVFGPKAVNCKGKPVEAINRVKKP